MEQANALIFEAIKKIFKGEKKGKWAEVMPKAVWSHNTTILHHLSYCLQQRLCYPKKSSIKVYVQQQKHHLPQRS
jgi:hypothetical protein